MQARLGEFTTHPADNPTIVQFAANQVHTGTQSTIVLHLVTSQAHHFAGCAELVANHARGIDLNCGCPQVEEVYLYSSSSTIVNSSAGQ